MQKNVILVFSLLMICLVACSVEAKTISGTVINKEYKPAHDEMKMFNPECGMNLNGKFECGKIDSQPRLVHYSAIWNLVIDTGNNSKIISVSEKIYNQYKIGDFYEN